MRVHISFDFYLSTHWSLLCVFVLYKIHCVLTFGSRLIALRVTLIFCLQKYKIVFTLLSALVVSSPLTKLSQHDGKSYECGFISWSIWICWWAKCRLVRHGSGADRFLGPCDWSSRTFSRSAHSNVTFFDSAKYPTRTPPIPSAGEILIASWTWIDICSQHRPINSDLARNQLGA